MRPSAKERKFWRWAAATLGLLLCVGVIANILAPETVPSQILLLVLGSLIAIGIGNTIHNPGSSPAILKEHEEIRLRRGRYAAAFVFSLLLGLLLLLTDLRGHYVAYVFVPLIATPFGLLLRDVFLWGRGVPGFFPLVAELAGTWALLMSLALLGRSHFEAGNPRHDLARLLFFVCLFGWAFIVTPRFHAFFGRKPVFIPDGNSGPRERRLARYYLAGYAVFVLSAILFFVIMLL